MSAIFAGCLNGMRGFHPASTGRGFYNQAEFARSAVFIAAVFDSTWISNTGLALSGICDGVR